MGTFAAVGLGLMGVPYFYVVALVAAIGETIPIVGPVIGGIAAVAVAVSVSTKLAIMVGVYFLVLHQLEANILVPKIMERRVGVSPVAVMAALSSARHCRAWPARFSPFRRPRFSRSSWKRWRPAGRQRRARRVSVNLRGTRGSAPVPPVSPFIYNALSAASAIVRRR